MYVETGEDEIHLWITCHLTNKTDHEYGSVWVKFVNFILFFALQATLFIIVFGSYVTALVCNI